MAAMRYRRDGSGLQLMKRASAYLQRWLTSAMVWLLLCGGLIGAVSSLSDCSTEAADSFRDRIPGFASQWNLTVGSGAEYQANCFRRPACVVDLSIVGQETVKGKAAYWMEVSSGFSNSSSRFLNKALFYIDGNKLFIPTAVTELPGHPPMTVPNEWIMTWTRGEFALAAGYIEPYSEGEWGSAPPLKNTDYGSFMSGYANGLPQAKEIGTETITTPAGTFLCQHWQFKAVSEQWHPNPNPTDVWLSKGAGPFGIVEARTSDKVPAGLFSVAQDQALPVEIVLTRILSNVQDQISQNPAKSQVGTLFYWLWEQKGDLLQVCVPQLGLPLW